MSLFSPETMKINGESVGISNLSEDILNLLCQDTEYRVREIIQEASKFMRHGRRYKLTTEDISYVLHLKHVDPIYGYDNNEPLSFRQIQSNSNISGGFVYYLPNVGDKELDFDHILTAPLPKIPPPVHLSCHWLAIEGIQPLIPENPSYLEEDMLVPTIGSTPATTTIPISTTSLNSSSATGQPSEESGKKSVDLNLPTNKYVVKHHLSKEHQMYFETVTNILLSTDVTAIETTLSSLRLDAGIQQLLPYFVQFIAELVMKHLKEIRKCALALKILNSLIHNNHLFIEPYLHQLMPTLLTLIVGKKIGTNRGHEDKLMTDEDYEEWNHWKLREDASALIIHISTRYGQLYPTLQPRIIKTLLKALFLSSTSTVPNTMQDRNSKDGEEGSRSVESDQIRGDMDGIEKEPSFSKSKVKTAESSSSIQKEMQGEGIPHWPSLYGALVTLRGMGNEVLELFLLPNIKKLYNWVSKPIESDGRYSLQQLQKEEEGQQRCLYALLAAMGQLMKSKWMDESFIEQRQQLLRPRHHPNEENEKMVTDEDEEEFRREDDMISFLREKFADAYECFGEQLLSFIESDDTSSSFVI